MEEEFQADSKDRAFLFIANYGAACTFDRDCASVPVAVVINWLAFMEKVIYTGTNFEEVKRLCGNKVLAPYFCMGFSMLSLDTGEGFETVNEGDAIVLEEDGTLRIERR